MRTPAGKECKFFYGDYHRGREVEECRLLADSHPPQQWQPSLCFTCPVPSMLRANACEHMVLHGSVERPLFVLPKRVKISAYCSKHDVEVDEPHIGCGQCHSIPPVFTGEDREQGSAF